MFRISKNNASDTQNPGDDGDRNARTDGHDAPHGDAGADRDTCSDSRPDRGSHSSARPDRNAGTHCAVTAVPVQDQSGEFRSDTGDVHQHRRQVDGDRQRRHENAQARHLRRVVRARNGDRTSDVVFNVGGNVSYASSKAIRLDNVPLTQTFLGSTSVDVTSGTDVPVNVTWHFNGTYSNQNIATNRGGGHPSH